MDCVRWELVEPSVQGPGFVFTGFKESLRGSLDGVSL